MSRTTRIDHLSPKVSRVKATGHPDCLSSDQSFPMGFTLDKTLASCKYIAYRVLTACKLQANDEAPTSGRSSLNRSHRTMGKLAGKVVVVTGGNSGIGLATAK